MWIASRQRWVWPRSYDWWLTQKGTRCPEVRHRKAGVQKAHYLQAVQMWLPSHHHLSVTGAAADRRCWKALEDGGASSDMLTRARAERRRLAEEQLVSAMHSRSDGQPSGAECTLGETCDSAALAEAIKRAVEAGATAELLHEAQMDLQKLSRGKLAAALAAARATAAAAAAADSETAAPLAAAGLVDLQAALRSTQGIPAAQLNEAKRLLRTLREIASPPAIQPEVVVVTKQSPSPPRSEPRGSTALPQVGLQAVLRKRSTSPSHRQRGSSPGRVSPEVLGRSVSTESPSVSALEAGLGKRSDRKSQRPTHPGTRERIRTMQREECTLQ